jgi:uncharacterized protein DUF2188
MVTQDFEIVQQDGGWAYKLGGVVSELYPTREAALIAAEQAAVAQAGRTEPEETDEEAEDLDNPP